MTICSETRQLKDTVLNLQAATGVTDQTNYGNDGVYAGGMGVTDGAFVLDGTDDYINLGTPLNAASGSASFWFKTTDTTGYGRPLTDQGGYFYVRFRGGTGTLEANVHDGAVNLTSTSNLVVNDGFWHHIVATWDSTTLRLYIDGMEEGTVACGAMANVTTYDLWLGGSLPYGTVLEMDAKDVRVISRAITVTEVRELYNANARPDITGTVLHLRPQTGLVDQSGTQDPATYNGGMGVVGRRYVFDGTDDDINTGASPINPSSGTVSMWIKTTDATAARRFFTDTSGYFYADMQVGGSVRASLYDTGYKRVTVSATDVTDGLWHLIVMRWDSANLTIQVDGDAQGSVAAGAINAGVTGVDFVFGGVSTARPTMDGDDLRIMNVAITAADVLSLYNGVPGFEPALPTRQMADTVLHLQANHGERDLSNHCNYGAFVGTDIAANSTDDEFVFNGTDDYISIPNAGEFASGESFTATAWIKVTALPPFATSVMVKGYGTAGQVKPWWMLLIDGAGAIGLQTRNAAAATSTATGGDVSDGAWHFVTGVYDATAATLTTYIDAVSVATAASVAAGAYGTNSGDLEIGGTHSARWWGGSADDIRILDRALSASEIALLYNKGVPRYQPVGLLGGEVLALEMSRHDVGVLNGTVLQLDGKTGITDQSPAGNDGTYNGGMGVTAGKFVFDGSDDDINLGRPLIAAAGTISFWLKTSESTAFARPLSDAGGQVYVRFRGSTGTLEAQLNDGGTNFTSTSTLVVNDDEWHHVVITWDSTTLRLYVDGAEEGTIAAGAIADVTTYDMSVGFDGGAGYIEMSADGIRILDRALSATEVTALYNNDISDESGNGNNGTLVGDALVSGTSIVLDGTGDSVSVPSIALSGDRTVAFWIYHNTTPSTVAVGGPTSNDYYPYIEPNTIYIRDGSGYVSWSTTTVVDQWYHIAISGNGTTATLYVDGVSKGAVADKSPTINTIGAYGDGTFPLDGEIRDFRVFDTALTAAEVAFLASSAEVEVPNTKSSVLAIVSSFDDWGDATLNALDFSGNGNVGTLTNMTTGDWVVDTVSGGTRALDFDGVDDYVDVPSSVSLNSPSTAVSASVWVKPGTTTDGIFFIKFKAATPAGGGDYWFDTTSSKFGVKSDGATGTIAAISTFSVDTWYHLSLVWISGTSLEFYVDGILQGTDVSPGTISSASFPLWMGRWNTDQFDGDLDDAYIWDRALSLDDIKALASTRNYFDCPVIVEGNLFGDAVKMLMGQTH